MKRLIVLAALLLGFATATTYRELSLDQIVNRAELGFFGRVATVAVAVQEGEPYTEVTFDVLRRLTGEAAGFVTDAETSSVTLSFYGGTLPNGRSVTVEGMPKFARGDEVLILAYDAPYYSPIVGFSQGFWRATPTGFQDMNGRLLSLSDAGRLLRDGPGSEQTAVLDALETELGEAQ